MAASPARPPRSSYASDELPLLVVRAARLFVEDAKRGTGADSSTDAGTGDAGDKGGDGAAADPSVKPVEPLTVVHGLATRFLDQRAHTTTVDLAQHLGVTKQSASEVVGLLERRGMVRRRPHPDDGRARTLELTEAGRAMLVTSRTRWRAVEDAWADVAGSEQLRHVRLALEAYLVAHARETAEPPAGDAVAG